MALPQTLPLPLIQNQDFAVTWGIGLGDTTFPPQLVNGTAYPLTGGVISASIRETAATTSPVLLSFSSGVVIGAPTTLGGIPCTPVSITITNAQTVGLPAGTWYYDILCTVSGQQTYLFVGPCTVQATGSR